MTTEKIVMAVRLCLKCCGVQRLRYPGGDPGNGPARSECLKCHHVIADHETCDDGCKIREEWERTWASEDQTNAYDEDPDDDFDRDLDPEPWDEIGE